MQLKITARHMGLNEDLRAFIDEKMLKIERHLHHETPISLVISSEKHGFIVEVSVHDRGGGFHGHADLATVEQAIEEAVDRLDKQLRRHKDKLVSRQGMEGIGKAFAAPREEMEPEDEEDDDLVPVEDDISTD